MTHSDDLLKIQLEIQALRDEAAQRARALDEASQQRLEALERNGSNSAKSTYACAMNISRTSDDCPRIFTAR